MKQNFHLTLPADINYSHAVREFSEEIFRSTGIPHAWIYRLVLVMDELFMNAVHYGSKNSKETIDLKYTISPQKIVCEVVDGGSNPRKKVSPLALRKMVHATSKKITPLETSGRGLALITRSWTDLMKISENEHGGITVHIEKKKALCDVPVIENAYIQATKKNSTVQVRVKDIEDLYEDVSTGKFHTLLDAILNYPGSTFVFDFEGIRYLEHRNFARFVELYLMISSSQGKVKFLHMNADIKKLFKDLSLRSIL